MGAQSPSEKFQKCPTRLRKGGGDSLQLLIQPPSLQKTPTLQSTALGGGQGKAKGNARRPNAPPGCCPKALIGRPPRPNATNHGRNAARPLISHIATLPPAPPLPLVAATRSASRAGTSPPGRRLLRHCSWPRHSPPAELGHRCLAATASPCRLSPKATQLRHKPAQARHSSLRPTKQARCDCLDAGRARLIKLSSALQEPGWLNGCLLPPHRGKGTAPARG